VDRRFVLGCGLDGVDVFHERTIAPPLAHVKRNISAIFAGING
jgi:hypothetical protein